MFFLSSQFIIHLTSLLATQTIEYCVYCTRGGMILYNLHANNDNIENVIDDTSTVAVQQDAVSASSPSSAAKSAFFFFSPHWLPHSPPSVRSTMADPSGGCATCLQEITYSSYPAVAALD